eukprot:900661-Pyramimonas_sp.AAC.1
MRPIPEWCLQVIHPLLKHVARGQKGGSGGCDRNSGTGTVQFHRAIVVPLAQCKVTYKSSYVEPPRLSADGQASSVSNCSVGPTVLNGVSEGSRQGSRLRGLQKFANPERRGQKAARRGSLGGVNGGGNPLKDLEVPN